MAAILCRLIFVEPCKGLAKCCEGCCSCLWNSCECFAKCCGQCCGAFEDCCEWITSFCDKPFSGCLFSAIVINSIAGVFGIVAITSGGDQCDEPLLILAIILLVCAVINALFGYYTYRTVNNDVDNPLFGDPNLKPSQKLYQFVKYDYGMAFYILFIIGLLILLFITSAKAGSCASDMAKMVSALCIVMFIYLGVGMLICLGYIAVDAFKEWSTMCECWMMPCMWPCLCIGCCLRKGEEMENEWKREQVRTNSPPNNAASDYPAYSQNNRTPQRPQQVAQPVVVVHQPQPVAPQQVVYAPPAQMQPIQPIQPPPQQYQQPYYEQPAYQQNQPAPVAVAAPVAPQHVSQPYNPEAAPMRPGVLVVNESANQNANEPGGPGAKGRNDSKEFKDVAVEKGKQAAVATGKMAAKGGKAALGWMAKKMNDLNEKVQEDKAAKGAVAEQQEGVGNHNTR